MDPEGRWIEDRAWDSIWAMQCNAIHYGNADLLRAVVCHRMNRCVEDVVRETNWWSICGGLKLKLAAGSQWVALKQMYCTYSMRKRRRAPSHKHEHLAIFASPPALCVSAANSLITPYTAHRRRSCRPAPTRMIFFPACFRLPFTL